MIKKAFFNWSGGKDSALALFKAKKSVEYTIPFLLTTVNEKYRRISMHGVREELLELQAKSVGIELLKVYMPEFCPLSEYEKLLAKEINKLKEQDINLAVFGDIFLEDLKEYREIKLKESGVKAIFPLWKQNTSDLIKEFIDLGFKTIVTCVDERFLDKSFAGRVINETFIKDLPEDVDPCGENGEFHTFVFDGPDFKEPIPFKTGEITHRKYENQEDPHLNTGFWYCDLLPET